MKKRAFATSAVLSMILFASPAFADSVVQIWHCTLNDGKSGDDVVAVSEAWLKAAKTMEGGADLEVYIEFPLAASPGAGGFSFVLVAADVKTWGLFNNDYEGSPAAEADEDWDVVADCSGSDLWESIEIE